MKHETRDLKNGIFLIVLLFKLHFLNSEGQRREEKDEEKEERVELGKTLWNAVYMVKRGKKLDSRWCIRVALPLTLPRLQIQVSSNPHYFKSKSLFF